MVFEGDKATFYPMTYSEYELTKKPVEEVKQEGVKTGGKKYYSPSRERNKMQKRAEKLETLIAEIDEKLTALNDEMNSPDVFSNYVKVGEIQSEIDALSNTQSSYMDEWAELLDKLSAVEE